MIMHRHDVYGPIHKALRAAMGTLLAKLGATDFSIPAEMAEALAALRAQLAVGALHLHHEDLHIHAALEARSPGSSGRLEADHHHHEQAFAELEDLMKELEAAPVAKRPSLGRELYLRFSAFFAADMVHMMDEETVVMPLLHALFTDAELMAIEGAIVASIPPAEAMAIMSEMIPTMHRSERKQFLSFVRLGAPPEVFTGILQHAAKPNLREGDWADLAHAFDLAA
jgi:iron-sulfur cluster repair protein YtfE (RIC family)